jgi:hypothetical protein
LDELRNLWRFRMKELYIAHLLSMARQNRLKCGRPTRVQVTRDRLSGKQGSGLLHVRLPMRQSVWS